jgi:hypothetical protein
MINYISGARADASDWSAGLARLSEALIACAQASPRGASQAGSAWTRTDKAVGAFRLPLRRQLQAAEVGDGQVSLCCVEMAPSDRRPDPHR